jgi:hypothetical protein
LRIAIISAWAVASCSSSHCLRSAVMQGKALETAQKEWSPTTHLRFVGLQVWLDVAGGRSVQQGRKVVNYRLQKMFLTQQTDDKKSGVAYGLR